MTSYAGKQKKFRWFLQTNGISWKTHRERLAQVQGTIVYDSILGTYTLTTSDGYTPAASTTLKNAKGLFRKYMHMKAV